MNIVFCRYKNVCEQDHIDAFKALGINVVEIFVYELGTDTLEDKAAAIASIIRQNNPMFVFSINYFPYLSIVCQGIGVKYVSVSVTCPMMEIYNITIRNSCNRVFLFDYEQYLSIRDENPDGIFYLPLGAGTTRIDNLLKNESGYLYDVSFVGSLYNEKDPFAFLKLSDDSKSRYEFLMWQQIKSCSYDQALLEHNISDEDVKEIENAADSFYPSDLCVRDMSRFVAINNYLSPHMTYLERVDILNNLAKNLNPGSVHLFTNSDTSELTAVRVHGGVATLTEMPIVFKKSKINLNLTTRSIKTGLPQRIWEILASEGFLLTNYQDEIPEFLEIGKHLVAYENDDELLELVRYYLDHEDQRKEIARAGHEASRAIGSTLGRVVDIIKAIA